MRKIQSKIWSIAFALSLVFLASAYYLRMPAFRKFVDAKTPLARKYLGDLVQEPPAKVDWKGEDPFFTMGKDAPAEPESPVRPAAPPPASGVAPDLQTIASNRALWPKTVKLTRAATFPAVSNGKIVGSLIAPAGSEVILHSIKDGKVGLEFNGGGAWLPVDQTDLLARAAQAPR
jgi:hypothetical protein